MRIAGCVPIVYNLLYDVISAENLKEYNLYDRCTEDFKYRLDVWDNETLFEEYYEMFDFIIEKENLSEEDDELVSEKVEELCDYIVLEWEKELPEIRDVEFRQPDIDGWCDTVYFIDCDYEKMYEQMKGE